MGRAFEYRKASKMKRWDKMSRLFPKLGKSITMAAKEGGIDPDMNPKLRTAIQNAKAENMPKDKIDAAIKRSLGKDAATFTEIVYEGKGPHGVLIVSECATDNTNRTVANIKSYFTKVDCSLVQTGSLDFMFNRKSVFEIEKTEEVDIEELELEFIDAGLEEIEENEGVIYIYGGYTDFGTLNAAIEEKGLEIKKASLKRLPTNPVEFTEEQLVDIEKLLDRIEEDDDVQEVYTNIA
ncbi:MAG: YebC/PmpR family DNA-binding transcriptional regulator [Cyclobacteriaceae bacterium]